VITNCLAPTAPLINSTLPVFDIYIKMSSTTGKSSTLQLCFVGTGVSTGQPYPKCLTCSYEEGAPWIVRSTWETQKRLGLFKIDANWPDNILCASCRTSQCPSIPGYEKNIRGEPSLLLRKYDIEGKLKSVLVNATITTRSFGQYAHQWGSVSRIDAIVPTHSRECLTGVYAS
jgi:phosphoribosyl 1,2-cyclic phosphodiesterase